MGRRALVMVFWGRRSGTPSHTRSLALLLASAASLAWAGPARAQEEYQSRNLYGSVGLVDMPSARMAPDGELSAGASFLENTQRYRFSFQALPWLETSFRYSGLAHYDPSYPVYWDRSFGAKLRLQDESDVLPAIAVGINDLVGTGIYSGEYLVASKQFGTFDATLGLGWGRLATAATIRNPLTLFSNSFNNRINDATGVGQFALKQYFHGRRAGVFGGLVWQTPVEGLQLAAEYSSDAYALERSRGTFAPSTQFNIGANYQPFESVVVNLGWVYGKSVSGGLTFLMDTVHDPYPEKLGPEILQPHIRSSEEQRLALQRMQRPGSKPQAVSHETHRGFDRGSLVDALWQGDVFSVEVRGGGVIVMAQVATPANCAALARLVQRYGGTFDTVTLRDGQGRAAHCPVSPADTDAVDLAADDDRQPGKLLMVTQAGAGMPGPNATGTAAIRAAARQQDIGIFAINLKPSTVTVYYSNDRYFHETEALDRLIRVLMQTAPPDVEKFRLIESQRGQPQREFDVLRSQQERSFDQTGALDLNDGITASLPPMSNPALYKTAGYPQFSWLIYPQLRQELFDPDNPLGVQFVLGLRGTVDLAPGLFATGSFEGDLYDNFNLARPPDSVLPHVRSDFLQYIRDGKNGINDLQVNYRFRLAPGVFAQAKAGYLESMFGGVGGEILWRPDEQRWAVGIDGYQVWKRNFDRLLGFQSYNTFTGHVSIYYTSPWYGLNFAVHTGRYLAGDKGLTVEVTRRFSTGVEIGAFFTKTNVSAQQFGEGSFDKGIIIRIPLGWMAPINTQSQFNLDLRPVQRDGGQRLAGDTTLFAETQRASAAEMIQDASQDGQDW